jgi:hypothetical protein
MCIPSFIPSFIVEFSSVPFRVFRGLHLLCAAIPSEPVEKPGGPRSYVSRLLVLLFGGGELEQEYEDG